MDMTITLGWWIIPLMVTIALYAYAWTTFEYGGGDYSFSGVFNGIKLMLATVPALSVWLVWALLT